MFDERYARFLENVNAPDAKQALIVFIDHYLSMRHCALPELSCPIPALAADIQHASKDARNRFSAGYGA